MPSLKSHPYFKEILAQALSIQSHAYGLIDALNMPDKIHPKIADLSLKAATAMYDAILQAHALSAEDFPVGASVTLTATVLADNAPHRRFAEPGDRGTIYRHYSTDHPTLSRCAQVRLNGSPLIINVPFTDMRLTP